MAAVIISPAVNLVGCMYNLIGAFAPDPRSELATALVSAYDYARDCREHGQSGWLGWHLQQLKKWTRASIAADGDCRSGVLMLLAAFSLYARDCEAECAALLRCLSPE